MLIRRKSGENIPIIQNWENALNMPRKKKGKRKPTNHKKNYVFHFRSEKISYELRIF